MEVSLIPKWSHRIIRGDFQTPCGIVLEHTCGQCSGGGGGGGGRGRGGGGGESLHSIHS